MNVQRLNNLLASGKGHTVLFRLPEESLCTIVQQTSPSWEVKRAMS